MWQKKDRRCFRNWSLPLVGSIRQYLREAWYGCKQAKQLESVWLGCLESQNLSLNILRALEMKRSEHGQKQGTACGGGNYSSCAGLPTKALPPEANRARHGGVCRPLISISRVFSCDTDRGPLGSSKDEGKVTSLENSSQPHRSHRKTRDQVNVTPGTCQIEGKPRVRHIGTNEFASKSTRGRQNKPPTPTRENHEPMPWASKSWHQDQYI